MTHDSSQTQTGVRIGVSLWPQATSWEELKAAAIAADRAGLDSIWTWDHLVSMEELPNADIFEGWMTVAAWGGETRHATVGLLVGANTFRNPAIVASMASTLDHVTGGRTVIGLGAGWYEREHTAFGIPFGSRAGERLEWMDEAAQIIRRLLDGERVSHEGHYHLVDATVRPLPIQARLPLLIGGSGPTRTLRTTARYADIWNARGFISNVSESNRILDARCLEVGRDPSEIERSIIVPILIRDSESEAEEAFQLRLAHNHLAPITSEPVLLGPPNAIATALRPYLAAGFSHVIARVPAPHDHQTIERLAEVRDALEAASA